VSQINSLRAYTDCQKLFDCALHDPKGARAQIGTWEQCTNMRTRMHYFRKLDRDANAKTYPPGDPNHGTSIYDPFVVRLLPDEDGLWWVYVQPRVANDMVIEGLSEGGDQLIDANVTDGEAHEIHQIEDKSNAPS
jgi:hypothetical protein